jgi:hypothetical protein
MAVNDLASWAEYGPYTPEQLFAGDAKVVSNNAPSLVASLAKYELAALTATGVTTFVTGTHTIADAVVVAQPITAIGQQVPYFAAGFFNHAAITWPAALSTLALRKDFCGNSPIQVGAITP